MLTAHIGIDPGKKGAIAALDSSGCHFVADFSSYADMLPALERINSTYAIKAACLERVHAMPGQGVSSMFSFGENYGWWIGVLQALGWPTFTARPQDWQKGLIAKGQTSMDVAARLFPGAELHGPKGGPRDGRADALLIAHHARRTVG